MRVGTVFYFNGQHCRQVSCLVLSANEFIPGGRTGPGEFITGPCFILIKSDKDYTVPACHRI